MDDKAENSNESNGVAVERQRGWVKGQSGNPAGRKPGPIKQKLAHTFQADTHKEWIKRGPAALADLSSLELCKLVASLQPKNVNVNMDLGNQLAEFLQGMMQQPGDQATIIDANDINDIDDTD